MSSRRFLSSISSALGLLAVACSGPSGSAASLQSLASIVSLDSLYQQYDKVAADKSFTADLNSFGTTTPAAVLASALNASTNATLTIGSHSFSHLKDYFEKATQSESGKATTFKDQTEYWKSIDFQPGQKVSVSDLDSGLAVFEAALKAANAGTSLTLTTNQLRLLASAQVVFLAQATAGEPASLDLVGPGGEFPQVATQPQNPATPVAPGQGIANNQINISPGASIIFNLGNRSTTNNCNQRQGTFIGTGTSGC